jgi:hypothetical protein
VPSVSWLYLVSAAQVMHLSGLCKRGVGCLTLCCMAVLYGCVVWLCCTAVLCCTAKCMLRLSDSCCAATWPVYQLCNKQGAQYEQSMHGSMPNAAVFSGTERLCCSSQLMVCLLSALVPL